jgi:hypothetical protein
MDIPAEPVPMGTSFSIVTAIDLPPADDRRGHTPDIRQPA